MATTLLDLIGSLLLILGVGWGIWEGSGSVPLALIIAGAFTVGVSFILVQKGGGRL